ncbi:MAG: radical SAM protein [Nitrospirae bacterium]|nr:radical SAM protein [Nitrospirota bacterium]
MFPLGLACLKAQLTTHEVRVIDLNVCNKPFDKLRDTLMAFCPEIIGISIRNIDSTNKRQVVFYYNYIKDTLDVIKQVSDAVVVSGGSGFSMFAEEIMKDEQRIDFGVFLEGEITFPLIIENISEPEKVASVYYRKNGEVLFTGKAASSDVSILNAPLRAEMNIGEYRKASDAIGVETKRGCALNCTYCIYGFLNGKSMRLRRPPDVVDEIEELAVNSGVTEFTFVDSMFNVPKRHAGEICEELIRRDIKGLSWSAWFSEKSMDKEFIALIKRAGCKTTILSPDGFSDTVLERLGKNITKGDILRTYELLRASGGIEVSYNFFKNPPGQDVKTFIELTAFSLKAKLQMGDRVHFEFNSMRIEPHTALYKTALAEGIVAGGEDLLYPKYYTNPGTPYIETMFNALIRLKELRR